MRGRAADRGDADMYAIAGMSLGVRRSAMKTYMDTLCRSYVWMFGFGAKVKL